MEQSKKPIAKYEPGELDKTRRNIGFLEPEEAKKMIQTLGGEIGIEKSVPFDEKKLPPRHHHYKVRHSVISDGPAGGAFSDSSSETRQGSSSSRSSFSTESASASSGAAKKQDKKPELQHLNSKIRASMDEILVTFGIKPRLGFFSQLINKALNRNDRVAPDYIPSHLQNHVKHVQRFTASVKTLIKAAPESYRSEIENCPDFYYRVIKFIAHFETDVLLKQYNQLAGRGLDVSVAHLIPITQTLFSFIYRLYFLGTEKVNQLVNKLYTDVSKITGITAEKLQIALRDANASWIYLYEHASKNLYPLLMRMCCDDLVPYPEIFKSESSNILAFLGLSKFDLFFPEKNAAVKKETPSEVEELEEVSEEEKPQTDSAEKQLIQGLNILETLFPESGWLKINTHPDMYPYFQAVFNFPDGINYLHKENPLQITAILLRITEDFLKACRNIPFDLDPELASYLGKENIQSFFNRWAEYREVLFEKKYCTMLKDYVNSIYSNSEYMVSQLGKKAYTNLQWYAHNQFLPYLRFDIKFLDRPEADSMLPPINHQVTIIKDIFGTIIKRAEEAWQKSPEAAVESKALGASKLWEPYQFPMPTAVSKRLDVLLGGKRSKNANNLNLMKYTYYVFVVLDWWINNKSSPAYTCDTNYIYRMEADGLPSFSVQPVENVNKIFADNVKKLFAKNSAATADGQ